MTNLVNGFSKDNYRCNYYMEDSVNSLNQKHKADCLKIFHLNVESFNTNGAEVAAYLECLTFEYDIICLTEIRVTNPGKYTLRLFLIIIYALTVFKNIYVLDLI